MTIGAHTTKRSPGIEERASSEAQRDGARVGNAEGTDSAKEVWAALLLQNIASRVVQLGTGEQSEAAAGEGGARRAGDGKLTFGAASLDGSGEPGTRWVGDASDGGSGTDSIGQMHLELDGGRLGTVYLTVQRQGTAVSVVVGVADPIQRALVELELGSLTQALRAAGLNVGSVRVLHPDAAGTALAQGRRGMTIQSAESASSAYRSYRSRQQADAEDGLDVVG
jgi:Flagellar hook-length control protein FliK